MQNRTIQPSPIVKNRKISAPGKETKPTTLTKSEGFHKKCSQISTAAEKPRIPSAQSKTLTTCKKPSVDTKVSDKPVILQKPIPSSVSRPVPTAVERSRPPSVISKAPSTLSTSSKKTVNKKVSNLLKQPNRQKSTLALRSRLEVSLSRADLKQLVTKFGEVSSTVLQIATSRRPVGARSLEALLNLEISKSLGGAVNDPAFSQAFIQATRRLLEELVRLYEGGKLNPKLLREREKEKRSFIRANSATTVCYRDQYFKELVMNILQSMTSSEIEEEVAGKAARSEESSERIRIIRDMVRSEAGLEPEDFRELERRLEELRRSLSRNKLEMEKAASEVDKIISQHIVKRELSTSSFQIPKPAREVWRGYKRLESGSDGGERGTCKNENGCCEQISCSRTVAEDGSEKYKKSLDIVGDKECFEKGNSDEVQNIRPQLKHLVHEELLRIKIKEEDILNRDREFDRNNRLGDTPKSSFESVEFKSAASNFSADDDDEINEEETRTFLEALKAEIEENNITNEDILNSGPQGVCIRVLERIDEAEDESNYRETAEKPDSSASSQRKHSSCSLNAPSIDLEPKEYLDENLMSTRQHNTDTLENQSSEKSLIERVKSQLCYQEASEVKNVLVEMKDAFETVQVMSDVFSAFKISEDHKKETEDADETTKFNAESDFYLWDFTVGEVANVLVNISVKINSLPEYLKETASTNLTEERKEAFQIMSVLDKYMNASNPINHDVTDAVDETSFPIKKFAKTFSFLSNTLSSSPREMKSESISVFNPPKSLVDTLYTLSSTAYFRDCFTSVRSNPSKKSETTKDVEIVKPYNINENTSSGDMLNINLDNQSLQDKYSGAKKKIYSYTRDIRSPDDLNENLGKFEHFMGLTASVMTVQNVSDMFLFLSTVLNDVPERLKSEKILDLDPPSSLLKALDIMYCEGDIDSVTDLEKKKSFASLTIQNVSDFLLTLSKTFDDVPDRLKDSIIADLRPPQSLLRAITLLTSLSHFSILESRSRELEEVHKENLPSDNHETFFDAVASVSSIS